MYAPVNPSYIKVGCEGVLIAGACYHDVIMLVQILVCLQLSNLLAKYI